MRINNTEVYLQDAPGVFGDGMHESTRVCADLLFTLHPEGKSVLDIGTGTGILSILAKKWGAAEVYAVDIDYAALMTARANFKANGVEVRSGLDIFNEGLDVKADITIANLCAHDVRDFISLAPATMAEGGVLIFSFPAQFDLLRECKALRDWEIIGKREGVEFNGFIGRMK